MKSPFWLFRHEKTKTQQFAKYFILERMIFTNFAVKFRNLKNIVTAKLYT